MTGPVFVSYAREDAGLILPLARALLHHGVDLWVDQLRISPGANWDKSIEEALDRCTKMLLFLSPAAVASEEEWKGEVQHRNLRSKDRRGARHRAADLLAVRTAARVT